MSETEFARADRLWRETCQLNNRVYELEAKCAKLENLLREKGLGRRLLWQSEMLERAKGFAHLLDRRESEANSYRQSLETTTAKWLADLEKGPTQ